MTAIYTILIPPTRVTQNEANFVNSYRRANRVTTSETLRRCLEALKVNGRDIKRSAYGSTKLQLPPFLVDKETAEFIDELAYEKDLSRCQIIRSAIDCMSKKQEVKK